MKHIILHYITFSVILLSALLSCSEHPESGDPNIPPAAEISDLRAQAKKGAICLHWVAPEGTDYDSLEVTWIPATSGTQPVHVEKGQTNILISNLLEGERHTFTVKTKKDSGLTSTGSSITMNISTQNAGSQTIQSLFPTDFNLRYVPAGTFDQGSKLVGGNAEPEHRVILTRNFFIGETEVTYKVWTNVYQWATNNGYSFNTNGTMGDGTGDNENHPVTYVSWKDVIVWCNALSQKLGLNPVYTYSNQTITNSVSSTETYKYFDNIHFNYDGNGYRLATEAEWEFTARYIDSTIWTRGDAPSGWQDNDSANGSIDTSEIENVAWLDSNSGGSTHEVAQKATNALGIHDMSGSIYEWCFDSIGYTYYQDGSESWIDPVRPSNYHDRVVKGGCWGLSSEFLQVSFRGGYPNYTVFPVLGFRIVRNDQ